MTGYNKNEYLRFLLYKTKLNLARFDISQPDLMLINSIFEKLIYSNNIALDLFILLNVKGLKNLAKYIVYVLKKADDNTITFDNLSQNIKSDSEFIESEVLNFLSNPGLKENITLNFIKKEIESYDKPEARYEPDTREAESLHKSEEALEDETEESETDAGAVEFRKHYLELIQTESHDTDVAYELPLSGKVIEKENEDAAPEFEETDHVNEEQDQIQPESESEEEVSVSGDDNESDNLMQDIDSDFRIKSVVASEEKDDTEKDINKENETRDRILLSREIQEEILASENEGSDNDVEIYEEIEETEEAGHDEPTNTAFTEFENEIIDKNEFLDEKFDQMRELLETGSKNEEKRSLLISGIAETSQYLEDISRKMSLEIISGIYQSISLSFEKISEGKYDISEGTISLFKKGLLLVTSLIKGDDYFGYKDILKSIENIKNALLEEKEKRNEYMRRKNERMKIEKSISERFPEESQKPAVVLLRQLVKDTGLRFKNLEKISGEYQIYEALRSLSGALSNLKDIVRIGQELKMKELVHLAEGSYVFVKFLQNYRINPVSIETKEIFGYIIYNFKLLVLGRPVEDLELFISYLNDPVKIFSKEKKKS